MANVIFKRGAQASLPATGQDGIFYLTTDTNRLYVGQGSGKAPQLLNQTVNVVEALANLPTNYVDHPEVAVNDFYYCKEENILAVCTKTEGTVIEWTQINPDTNTFINDAGFTNGSLNANKDTLSYTLNLYYNDTTPLISRTLDIKAADLNELIEIPEVEQASVGLKGAKGSSDVITISTTGTGANTGETLHLTGGTNIDLTLNTNTPGQSEISIAHENINVTKNEAPSTATALAFGGEFVVTEDVTAGSNGHVTSIVEKKYKLPALPSIPSQEEIEDIIEDKLLGLDPMRYKGTVNTTTKLPTSNISVGDTYMVSEMGVYGESEQLAVIGDLFIAVGAENPETGYIDGIVTWTHVPSGNETYTDNDTQYKLEVWADNTINLLGGTGESFKQVSQVQFQSDTLHIEVPTENTVAFNLEWGTF